MQYMIEVLLIPPFLYCLPLLIQRALLDCRLNKEETLGYICCCAGSFLILYYLLPGYDHLIVRTAIEFFIMLIMLLVFVKEPFIKTVLSFGITVMIIGICETILFIFFVNKFKGELLDLPDNSFGLQLNLILYIAAYLITYAIYFAKKRKMTASVDRKTEYRLLALFIGLILIDAIIIIIKIETMALKEQALIPILPYLVVFIILTLLCCFIFVRQSFREKAKNEEIIQYQQTLIELYDETRMFRHNYKNTMMILLGFCIEGDYEGLKNKITENIDEFNLLYNDIDILQVMRIENIALKWLLMYKISTAQKLGIKVKVTISKTLKETLFEKNLLITMLGILLDNAIDAAKESNEKELEIMMLYNVPDTIISIGNSYLNEPDVEKVFQRNYSTKSGHDGIGLYQVKRITSQYDNIYMNVKCENGYFYIDINILNSDFEIE